MTSCRLSRTTISPSSAPWVVAARTDARVLGLVGIVVGIASFSRMIRSFDASRGVRPNFPGIEGRLVVGVAARGEEESSRRYHCRCRHRSGFPHLDTLRRLIFLKTSGPRARVSLRPTRVRVFFPSVSSGRHYRNASRIRQRLSPRDSRARTVKERSARSSVVKHRRFSPRFFGYWALFCRARGVVRVPTDAVGIGCVQTKVRCNKDILTRAL